MTEQWLWSLWGSCQRSHIVRQCTFVFWLYRFCLFDYTAAEVFWKMGESCGGIPLLIYSGFGLWFRVLEVRGVLFKAEAGKIK